MIRRILLALVLAISSAAGTQAGNDKTVEVVFEIRSMVLDANAQVFISGDLPQLGGWKADVIAMEYAGDHTWRRAVTLPEPRSFEYKYTLGSWEREAADSEGNSLPNFAARVSADTRITDHILAWTDGSRNFALRGQVTGTVEYHRNLQGTGLRERNLLVWLPPGYADHPEQRYPVLYMHDGQNIIDPATSSFGVDWAVDETVDRLIRAGEIPSLIVVGMNNTADRSDEYAPGPLGDAYMDFVVNTVKPFIDEQYRTLPRRERTFVAGSSMGGLVSFMLAWQHSDVFSAAICMSPAFRIREHDFMTPVLSTATPEPAPRLYIDNGGIGLEEDLQSGIDDMVKALRDRGYVDGQNLVYTVDPEARHSEGAWAQRMPSALQWLLDSPVE